MERIKSVPSVKSVAKLSHINKFSLTGRTFPTILAAIDVNGLKILWGQRKKQEGKSEKSSSKEKESHEKEVVKPYIN
jgi:hypothetical protein